MFHCTNWCVCLHLKLQGNIREGFVAIAMHVVLANHEFTHHHVKKTHNVTTHYWRINGISLKSFSESESKRESESF
jgi:hypothetical protein